MNQLEGKRSYILIDDFSLSNQSAFVEYICSEYAGS